jgi:hypothetical protein
VKEKDRRQTHDIRFAVADKGGYFGVSTVVAVLGGVDVFEGC